MTAGSNGWIRRYDPLKSTDLHRQNLQKSPSFDRNVLLHPFTFISNNLLIFLMLSSFLFICQKKPTNTKFTLNVIISFRNSSIQVIRSTLCTYFTFTSTNSKTRYLKGVPLDLTQKAQLVCELWIFLVLILPKMINHKRLELFEFRQLKNLLEIMFCHWCGFESRKVWKKQG